MKPWEKAPAASKAAAAKKRKRRAKIETRAEGEDDRLVLRAEEAIRRRDARRKRKEDRTKLDPTEILKAAKKLGVG